jgi:hypothetical protein
MNRGRRERQGSESGIKGGWCRNGNRETEGLGGWKDRG